MNNLTIKGGDISGFGDSDEGYGGGLRIVEGTLVLDNVTVSESKAFNGGAIFLDFGNLTATNSALLNSTAQDFGGAIYCDSPDVINLTSTNIEGNTAISRGGIYKYSGQIQVGQSSFISNQASTEGGAIYTGVDASVSISNTSFTKNSSQNKGGAMFCTDSQVTLNNCTLGSSDAADANTAAESGALYIDGAQTSKTFTISNASAFTKNTATEKGGGVFNHSAGTLSVSQTTFSGNRATDGSSNNGYGGGLYVDGSGTTSLDKTTLDGNSASNSGGAISFDNDAATLNLTNSTLSNNSSNVKGGGLMAANGTLNISNATFNGNICTGGSNGNGGAVYLGESSSSAFCEMKNVTLFGNSARINGGGLYYHEGALAVKNCLLAGNSATTSNDFYNFNGNNLQDLGYNIVQFQEANVPVETIVFDAPTDILYNAGAGEWQKNDVATPSQNLNISALAGNGEFTQTMAIEC